MNFACIVFLVLFIAVADAAGAYQELEASSIGGSTGFKMTGAAPQDYSGQSVSGAGDVNGDGIADMLIGAYQADPNVGGSVRSEAGIVHVLFGRNVPGGAAPFPDYDLGSPSFPNSLGFRIFGAANGDYCGFSVSAAGDIDADGIGDIIVGAVNASPPPVGGTIARSAAGISYVIFGRVGSTLSDIDLLTFTGASPLGFRILGEAASDASGQSVSTVGDVNGDGIVDIAVGGYAYDPVFSGVTRLNAGVVYVIFGRNTVVVGPFAEIELSSIGSSSTIGFRIFGAVAYNYCGFSVSSVGDVNGDNIVDILLGCPYARAPDIDGNTARVNAGISYIIFGKKLSGSATFGDIDLLTMTSGAADSPGFRIFGAADSDLSGSVVSGLGDVNGDGRKDFVVGAWGGDAPPLGGSPRSNAGVSYVIFGRSAATTGDIDLATTRTDVKYGLRILGAAENDNSGRSVGAAGDFNVDGFADILIGAYAASPPAVNSVARANAGISYLIFGRVVPAGGPAFNDVDLSTFSVPGRSGFRILGSKAGDRLGFSLSSAGDVNKDGYSDMLISALQYDIPAGNDAGATYVLFGTPALPTSQPSRQPSSQPSSQPTEQPTARPSSQPSSQPSRQPLSWPTAQPSSQPNTKPTSHPSAQPSSQPSVQPSRQPSSRPSVQPSRQPSGLPTMQPQGCPSSQPSCRPSMQPSSEPTHQPSALPTRQPTRRPSAQPTGYPTMQPSAHPSAQPSTQPTGQPTLRPSEQPAARPSSQPSSQPTVSPSARPSGQPSAQPSQRPRAKPSSQPSGQPSMQPRALPSTQPTARPSAQPSAQPSKQPSFQPSSTPSRCPSAQPTCQPSSHPSVQPSSAPTSQPSTRPTQQPVEAPSAVPSISPTGQPTVEPSAQPSGTPSSHPSEQPTVAPSGQPATKPSCQPSSQPSRRPSSQPSVAPSSDPTALPSGHPSSQPSSFPSSAPSVQPSAAPSAQPSAQPSSGPSSQPQVRPSAQPSSAPSNQPSAQPAAAPTSQPSAQPSSAPTSQPSHKPRASPSGQPTSAPSARPSIAPTGEWAVIVNQTSQLTKVAYPDGYVWACGKDLTRIGTLCVLADSISGQISTRYHFQWESVVSVLSTKNAITAGNSVVITGQIPVDTTISSDIATCTSAAEEATCRVKSFHDTQFLAASYVPYPNKVVLVGYNNVYASISILDIATSDVQTYHYTAYNMKILVLSQIQSPPYFVGSFVAGTAIRATASPVNYIVAGMVRTDGGMLSAMVLMPQSGEIVNSKDLVNAMALEVSGPDSFIAGGLLLNTDLYMSAYVVRANALYSTVQHCMRYVDSQLDGGRRALTTAPVSRTVVRGIVLLDSVLFVFVDRTHLNITSLTVLKTTSSSGELIKQVHVSAPNGTSLHCTDASSAGLFLSIACSVQGLLGSQKSVLFQVDQDLSFAMLPAGFKRHQNEIFRTESLPFKRTVLSITKTSAVTETSIYELTTAGNQGPSRRPTTAPSYVPSSQPSSAPSSQPSSSPTVAPSVSARPTSQPSSSTPTNTHRPTVAPTSPPTRQPSASPSTQPRLLPTARPSLRPTLLPSTPPSTKPSALRTARPTAPPSLRPTSVQRRPTTTPTTAPSSVVADAKTSHPSNRTPKYVVGVSVGGGLLLLILLYVYYHHERHKILKEELAVRKKAYFARLAELAFQERAAQAETEQLEASQAAARKIIRAELKAQKALQRAEERAQLRESRRTQGKKQSWGRGAGAVGPVATLAESSQHASLNSKSGSSANISSLHESEMSAELRHDSLDCDKPEGEDSLYSVRSSDFSVFSLAGSGSWESEQHVSEEDLMLHISPSFSSLYHSESSGSDGPELSYFDIDDSNGEDSL